VESQLDAMFTPTVQLRSGGYIVINQTEALVSIDVNSGRSTRAATQEETAVHTNVEAAAEVARQLRLRDLGGIVVVDFIDMRASKNQRKVEKAVKDALKADKARTTVGRISPNGLLEINRQRIQQALQLRTHRPCPTCNGIGSLASEEMVSLSILRRIEARAATGSIQGARISLHPELADALQNHYRRELSALEEEFDIEIEIIAAPGLHRPEERIEWQKREKPARPPKQKPAPITLQAWDLALPEDEEEEEDEELGEGDEDHDEEPHGAAETDEAAQRRKRRRRGGRKRKKKAVAGAGNGATETKPDLPIGELSMAEQIGFGLVPQSPTPEAEESAAPSDDFDEEDDEGPDGDLEEGPEENDAGEPGNGNGGGPKRRRRRSRRRRRK
jgi:ribonuclease E